MFIKLFAGITGCLIFSSPFLFSNGLTPYSRPPGIHVSYRGIWAVFDNPAGLTEEKGFSAGVSYHSAFLLKELSSKSLLLVFPMKKAGCVGTGFQYFGYELFSQQKGCIAYSKTFGALVSAGIRFDYVSTRLGNDYGKSTSFTGTAGVIARLTDAVRVGACIYNPQRTNMSKDGVSRYPTVMEAGMSWTFKSETELSCGVIKSSQAKEILRCGIRYRVSEHFLLHASVSGGSEAFVFGYTLKLGKLELGMASGYHYLLGFSPNCFLAFKNK